MWYPTTPPPPLTAHEPCENTYGTTPTVTSMKKRGQTNHHIESHFTKEIFDLSLKRLAQGKALPHSFLELLLSFFKPCYKKKQIPSMLKLNKTILLYLTNDPLIISNHILIALAITMHKFYTSTLTACLTNYGEQHKIHHYNQEGYKPQRNTTRHIQMLIIALEDAMYTTQDIYIYIYI